MFAPTLVEIESQSTQANTAPNNVALSMYTCTVHNMQGCTDVLLYTWGVLCRAGRPRINSGYTLIRKLKTLIAQNNLARQLDRVRSLRVKGSCQPRHKGVPPLPALTGEVGSELTPFLQFGTKNQLQILSELTAAGNTVISWSELSGSKKAARVILTLNTRESCRHAFRELRFLNLPCLYILEVILYSVSRCALVREGDVHQHGTRDRNNFRVQQHSTNSFINLASQNLVRLTNSLPEHIKQQNRKQFKQFKTELKILLISKAFSRLAGL
ncbi:hypothetical protein J6590_059827 [Homalodisca vitripennis]|nr:hypothetical protein J6590_059827 [Homalodisca vitripennis]